MTRWKTAVVFLPLCFSIPRTVLAQNEASATDAAISVDVNLVMLQATVTDAMGRFVSGLGGDDFQVSEDGRRQSIRFFRHEDVPAAIGLIVDNSGSMSRKKNAVTAAALTFVHSSNPGDQMFVVNFNEHASLGLPSGTPFSANAAELEEALNRTAPDGRTALYDAIETGITQLRNATLERKVLIVISDGGDNASHTTFDQVLTRAARTGITIYTIGLFDEDDTDRNPGVLRKIAQITGGDSFVAHEIGQVWPICRRIAEEIRNRYTIGYAPSNPRLDGSYRKVRVSVSVRDHERYSVRTRPGYFAVPVSFPVPHGRGAPR